MSTLFTNPVDENEAEHEDSDDYEFLIPRKYHDLDDQKFEKFTKRNDWN